ncbi:hypothetical protein DICPUDRAFT_92639 [Dictyostelium purpureum]|uniref:Riboflavin kinase n=1 Tax=Dictyostelium purpureum TaxID=5786 RepID=F0ZUY1_DICPU|nr:uncharacterized protein DICPUDRAFT_92639 [Dictyostelium purpureum]EGC32251.1 hypothetical protein DICPUDRAFT_92639 [Dictyostelium purpureum]|eukprot:XP_003291218.1 hypothetical protein DICPUDRAFT_92639 [Dictyostelium purpureum]
MEIERGSFTPIEKLPLYFKGSVITGFGRGSKQLGIPTANLPVEELEEELKDIPIGVYYGWANVEGLENDNVYPMAMSIGWNPFYKNTKKTIEIHLIHHFERDFYGAELRAIGLGFIRPMCDFKTLEELVKAINDDIEYGKKCLEKPEFKKIKQDPFFINKQ